MNWKDMFKSIIQKHQQNIADQVNNRINQYSVKQKRIGLVVFGLTVGIFCFLLILGMVGTTESGQAIRIDSISTAKDIHDFSYDRLKALPAKILDSVESIIKAYYKDQLH